LGLAGVSVALPLFAAVITVCLFLAHDRLRPSAMLFNNVLRLMLVLSAVSLICGLIAIIRRSPGAAAALLGVLLSLVNLGFIPTFFRG
jgi:hypothetical protein